MKNNEEERLCKSMTAFLFGEQRCVYAFPLMERSACSMRRLPLLTGRRFNFNREDGKGRIKSKVSYHVQIKLV